MNTTPNSTEVREIVRMAIYEGLGWFGTLPEPQGDVPERYHRWDDLGELADRILAALKPEPAAGDMEKAVMVCPQCEGEGFYADGVDEDACSTECTRCASNVAPVSAAYRRDTPDDK